MVPTTDVKKILLSPKAYLEELSQTVDDLLRKSTEILNSKVTYRIQSQRSMMTPNIGNGIGTPISVAFSGMDATPEVENPFFAAIEEAF